MSKRLVSKIMRLAIVLPLFAQVGCQQPGVKELSTPQTSGKPPLLTEKGSEKKTEPSYDGLQDDTKQTSPSSYKRAPSPVDRLPSRQFSSSEYNSRKPGSVSKPEPPPPQPSSPQLTPEAPEQPASQPEPQLPPQPYFISPEQPASQPEPEPPQPTR